MTATDISIIIVDDHQIMIDGIKALLAKVPGIQVVATSTNPTEIPDLIRKTGANMLLTDIQMPVMNGYELAKIVHEELPDIKIIALSISGNSTLVNKMIDECNISGYILKNISRNELVHAIQKVANGSVYFSDEVLEDLLNHAEAPTESLDDYNLTPREIEIIKLIEKEYCSREIADSLSISQNTVETHRKNILRKTNTKSLVGLVKFAYQHHLI